MANNNLITRRNVDSYNAAVNQINTDQKEMKKSLTASVNELTAKNNELDESTVALENTLQALRLNTQILANLVENL